VTGIVGLPELWLALTLLALGAFLLFDGVRSGAAVLVAGRRPSPGERALLVDGRSARWLVALGCLLVVVPGLPGRLVDRHGTVVVALIATVLVRETARLALLGVDRVGDGRRRGSTTGQDGSPAAAVVDRLARLALAATGVAVPWLVGVGLVHVALGVAGPLSTAGALAGGAMVAAAVAAGAASLAPRARPSRRTRVRRAGVRAAGFAGWLAVVQVTFLLVVSPGLRGALSSPTAVAVVVGLVVAAAGYAGAAHRGLDGLALLSAGGVTASLLALFVKPVVPAAATAAGAAVESLAGSPLPARGLTLLVALALVGTAAVALAGYVALLSPRAVDDPRPRTNT
jgi:hypothetical protein